MTKVPSNPRTGRDAAPDPPVNAYVLVFAVLLIPSGRLGDTWGPKAVPVRDGAVRGRLGGAWARPIRPAAGRRVRDLGRGRQRSAVAGPTLGGLIVTHWGWQWIFHVNVPVGVVALGLAAAVVLNTCFSLQRYGRQARPSQRLPADELDQAILAGLLDTFARTDLAQQAPAPSAAKPPTPATARRVNSPPSAPGSTRPKPPSSATWAPSRPAPCQRPSAASASRPSALDRRASGPRAGTPAGAGGQRHPGATDPRRARRAGQPAAPGHRARPVTAKKASRSSPSTSSGLQPRRDPADLPRPHPAGTFSRGGEESSEAGRAAPLAGLEPATCCWK
jgi:hypothetical protein